MNDTALVVVDMLYDFIDGSLACQNADEAVRETLAVFGLPIAYRGHAEVQYTRNWLHTPTRN